MKRTACIDGNEAVALVAHRLSEVVAIYPITPASSMGELADAYSASGRKNLWGVVPEVIEMQSEAGAAGVLHGAAQQGALATTFTASQGLLLMIPTMFKAAGELLPSVIHVAARTVATHALSIFGDHSDVMATRSTGFAMLCSASVQEAHDFALLSHATTLKSRVPFLHFFDGFRTSHEVNKIDLLGDDDLRALVHEEDVMAHRSRRLSPDRPVLRGSAQNPDVFFQAREASNPYYDVLPGQLRRAMHELAQRTGRAYDLVEYVGDPDAERVVVMMGSGIGAAEEAIEALRASGEKVGLVKVRLYRPFPAEMLAAAIPKSARAVVVLDRTKEPGAIGDPLYQDVLTALIEQRDGPLPRLMGGRYGLASKEFTPAMVVAALDALDRASTPRHFTLGIVDDVTRRSVAHDPSFDTDKARLRAIFYGIGSDGTVSASKATAKILAEATPGHAQAYFVYDSKKSGQLTASHVRYDDHPIRSTYLVTRASFLSFSRQSLLDKVDALALAAPGARVLIGTSHAPERVFDELSLEAQEHIVARGLEVYCIDVDAIARELALGDRTNVVLQAAFFALSGVLPLDEATSLMKHHAEKAYKKAGAEALARNIAAIDRSISAVHRVPVGAHLTSTRRRPAAEGVGEDPFVRRVTARLLEGEGDLLPVSAMPPDGTFPTGTARYEKRGLADEIPLWEPSLCIDCGKCAIVCPHAAIRMKAYRESDLGAAPEGFKKKPFKSRELPGSVLTIQVSPEDCTGCTLCVAACPAESKTEKGKKSLQMAPIGPHRDVERAAFEHFLTLPETDATKLNVGTVKGSQLKQPLFEFSGACSGCGETPYLKLLTQLFGDRLIIANATGCSSIFGGNLPTTPWARDRAGRGPAWANSLFEDNAEFGLGLRLGLERHVDEAKLLLMSLASVVGDELAATILAASQKTDAEVAEQRGRIAELRSRLSRQSDPRASRLLSIADDLVQKTVWIIGGDGWAYDIGYGGLDHVLASGRKVNVLVLDTEVYSNTGGQASKATPRGAIAKFAASGKPTAKKDLGRIAMTYENVYVAQVALGADDRQTIRAFLEAEAFDGPSLVIAYSTCIAHGIDLCESLSHQQHAVESGYWPLYHHDPRTGTTHVDARQRSLPLDEFEQSESRFGVTRKDLGDHHVHLLTLAEHDVDARWRALKEAEQHGDHGDHHE